MLWDVKRVSELVTGVIEQLRTKRRCQAFPTKQQLQPLN